MTCVKRSIAWLGLGLLLATSGCIYSDRDRRRDVWQREKEAYNELWDMFDHYFIEPR